MKRAALLLIAGLSLAGCKQRPLKIEAEHIASYGDCKVFRLVDYGQRHYFTNCGGK